MGCCLFVVASWLSPRVGIVLAWLFWNERTSAAFSTFLIPALGFIFLPWTTLMFIFAYAVPIGVSGLGWFLVILAFLVDIGSYTSGQRAQSRRRSSS